MSDGVSPGPFGARAPECPKKCPESVPRASKRCPGHSGDTLGTLFGHSGARAPKGPGNTHTLGDTPRDTSGPKGSRDSCSWPGSSQSMVYRPLVCTKSWLPFCVAFAPPLFTKGNWPFPSTGKPPFPSLYLWKVLPFLQDLLCESTVFRDREIGGKR